MNTTLLLALLGLFDPQSPAVTRILADEPRVLADSSAAIAAYAVPLVVLYVVGFQETWCGTHPGEGHGWGAPRSFRNRHIPGTASDAARILVNGFAHCHTWEHAAAWYRSGMCGGNAVGDRYGRLIVSLVERTSIQAHVATPDHLR